jgi:hypothetical protein
MKKCPPGVICIENITMMLLFIIFGIIVYLIHFNMQKQSPTSIQDKIVIKQESPSPGYISQIPSYPYNNLPEDVLLNPYAPPLKDERYFIPELTYRPPGTIPINISTNIGAVDTTYRQLGILTPLNGVNKDNILPLMGRPLYTNRQKYQYYTISNQHNNVKLPIFVKGRNGTNEYGVDQLYNGDSVYVEGYNEAFKVRTYETDTIKYLPFL